MDLAMYIYNLPALHFYYYFKLYLLIYVHIKVWYGFIINLYTCIVSYSFICMKVVVVIIYNKTPSLKYRTFFFTYSLQFKIHVFNFSTAWHSLQKVKYCRETFIMKHLEPILTCHLRINYREFTVEKRA